VKEGKTQGEEEKPEKRREKSQRQEKTGTNSKVQNNKNTMLGYVHARQVRRHWTGDNERHQQSEDMCGESAPRTCASDESLPLSTAAAAAAGMLAWQIPRAAPAAR
jgi:hypothetical protein